MNARKCLFQAVEMLVQEKPIDKISVQEILDAAEVSRRTFYKYFSDKYDLANSLYEQYVTEHILSGYNGRNWPEILIEILRFIQANLPYYQQLRKYRGQSSFWDFLMAYSFDFHSAIYKHNLRKDALTPSQEYDVWYVTAGNMKVLEKWMERQCDLEPEKLVEDIISHTSPCYYQYLE